MYVVGDFAFNLANIIKQRLFIEEKNVILTNKELMFITLRPC